MHKGKLFVFSGPSGTGKGTIVKELLKSPDTWFSVSCTTRAPREGEIDGVHYFFVTQEKYDQMIEEGGFLEHASIYNNSYGTPKAPALEAMEQGKDVILDIEMQGAFQIKEAYPDAILVFVLPPSLKELSNRIHHRGTETEEQIQVRMATTLQEIEQLPKYHYFLINDDLDRAVEDAKSIIKAEHCKVDGAASSVINRFKEEK